MKELYTPETLSGLNRRLKARWIILGAVSAVLLGLIVWAMIARIEWLALASVAVCGVFAVFWTGMFCRPLMDYRKLVRSALTGRPRGASLEFVRAEPQVSTVAGVPCRGLIFLDEPDKHGTRDRLFYWDADFPLPELAEGAVYAFRYVGRSITALDSAPVKAE